MHQQVPGQFLSHLILILANPHSLQQIVPKGIRLCCFIDVLIGLAFFSEEYLLHCIQYNLYVAKEGDILHILKVSGWLAVPRDRIAPSCLGQPAKPRAIAMPLPLHVCHKHHIPYDLRAGIDNTHITFRILNLSGSL